MHIPDGYLSPETYGTMYVVMVPLWYQGWKKVKSKLSKDKLPFLGIGAAFSFIIMMFNIPIPGGSTGHAVGGALLALVFGPWAAFLSISSVIVIQALIFGDGGITAIAANCFTMAFILPFSAYYTYKLIGGWQNKFSFRQRAAAFLSGYFSLVMAAVVTGFLFGIQPIIAVSADGHPLYSPYPLSVAMPAMTFSHLFFFGFIEGLVTVGVMTYLVKSEEGFLKPEALRKKVLPTPGGE